MVAGINEDVAAAPLLYFNGGNYEELEQHEMVANIDFEAIVYSTRNNFFHKQMI